MVRKNKRLLITISFSFSIRYIIRTGLLERIRQFATPVIILTWHQEDLIAELEAANIEVHVIAPITLEQKYFDIRRKINYWFEHFRIKYSSKKIQENYLRLYYPKTGYYTSKTIAFFNLLKHYLPGYSASVIKQERSLLKASTEFNKLKEQIKLLHADAVFTLTPFHLQEDILLRACKECGLQMITSILSFDNITKRGWIPIEYDTYMVWNQYNKDELNAIYPFTKQKAIHIAGAPQFDFYNKKEWLFAHAEWRKMVGIQQQENRKIILYAGGPLELFPQEPMYLKDIDDAINQKKIAGNPLVLFRCHPVDNIERWRTAIGNSENIVFDTSWTGKEKLHLTNIKNEDIKKLCSTLAYTDVHVNVCSTMTLDGSMFNKPQIGPAYLDSKRKSKRLKQLYFQKHFEPIMYAKGIKLAESKDELIDKINIALTTPEQFTSTHVKVLEQMITYTDGNSTARVSLVLENALYPSINQMNKPDQCLQPF